MSSKPEWSVLGLANPDRWRAPRGKWVEWIAFSWGFCAFFPVGLMYLHLLMMSCALAWSPDLPSRLRSLRDGGFLPPIVAMLGWVAVAVVAGDWYADTATRIFHCVRVALVLVLGLMLTAPEGQKAITGFVLGAILAALIVATHHVWGLPSWDIWASLLLSRNNLSSGNMISMAAASAICLLLALARECRRGDRWLALTTALVLGTTVALHAVSRNSQLLLVILPVTVVLFRFRSVRAALSGLTVVLLLVAVMWHFSPTTQSRFAELVSNLQAAEGESNYGTSGGVRLRMYEEALLRMIEHPAVGTGVGSWLPHWRGVWKSIEPRVAPEAREMFSAINNPHNDFLLNGMETGVIGLLILVWLLSRFVVQGWRLRSTAGGVCVIFGVGVFVTALVNAPLRDAALGMTLLWLLAASAVLGSGSRRRVAHA